jgi:hypothetical protein
MTLSRVVVWVVLLEGGCAVSRLGGSDNGDAGNGVETAGSLRSENGDLGGSGDHSPGDGAVGTSYNDLGSTDAGQCPPGQAPAGCVSPIANNAGCGPVELCGADGTGNGLDDNCDGKVDETCSCTPGQVERCFLGPPGKHNVGACTDGTQTCFGTELGSWGPCVGSIGPGAEICDGLDNDCNGCADDSLCCDAALSCPAPGDPRIADKAPYTDVPLNGEQFYNGAALTWSWKITGGPCDQLFSTTTGTPGKQSFSLSGANSKDAVAHFTLSGDYTITMTAHGSGGSAFTCTWVQHIVGPGVRFELCWDHEGTAGGDLDLHVHRPGTTTPWFGNAMPFSVNTDDCYYWDCNPDAYACTPSPTAVCAQANWGESASSLQQCIGAPPTAADNTWSATTGNCPNPRLDIDNVIDIGRPENSNIDNPRNGDTLRAMIHYFGQNYSASKTHVEEHPIVNIYCGGRLKATYGAAPDTLGPCPGPTCFDFGSGWGAGLMWRVADVTAIVDAQGNTTDCDVAAIHPPGKGSGYYVTNNSTAY